jgi:hypothetical protein
MCRFFTTENKNNPATPSASEPRGSEAKAGRWVPEPLRATAMQSRSRDQHQLHVEHDTVSTQMSSIRRRPRTVLTMASLLGRWWSNVSQVLRVMDFLLG